MQYSSITSQTTATKKIYTESTHQSLFHKNLNIIMLKNVGLITELLYYSALFIFLLTVLQEAMHLYRERPSDRQSNVTFYEWYDLQT